MRQIKIRVRKWQLLAFGCVSAAGILLLAARTYRSGAGAVPRMPSIRPPTLARPELRDSMGLWEKKDSN